MTRTAAPPYLGYTDADRFTDPIGTPALTRLWQVQAAYYLLTGIWSLVDICSFQKVTGPKTDIWLVRTVGVLVSVIGGVLAYGGSKRPHSVEVAALGVGSAASLAAIDAVYTAKGTISPIYLLDAVAEIALIVVWAWLWRGSRSGRSQWQNGGT